MNESPVFKILVCHHKNSDYIKNDCIVPIQVGRALNSNKLEYCIGDDTGDNISSKNKSWCELTAIYWAWKNIKADYYGLMHYRRYLSFSENDGFEVIDSLDDSIIQEKNLSPEFIKKKCIESDIITSPVWDVHPAGLPNNIMTNYALYGLDHYSKDLDVVIEIVKENYPQYYLPLLESLHSSKCFFANIAIMKKQYFFEYCEFAFGVLEKAEVRIDIEKYDSYQKRIWGFIAERLINAYVIYCKRKYKNIKISTQGILYLVEKNKVDYKKVENSLLSSLSSIKNKIDERINICLSFDDRYYAHAMATLNSLIETTSPEQELSIYILCDSKLNKANRSEITDRAPSNVTINFVEVNPEYFSALPLNRSYISLNTYYRLVIHQVLSEVDRVIYLDSDMIVCSNIVELWSTSLDGCCIGACLDEGGILQSRRLGLGADSSYFNAGMIIFDLALIRESYSDVFLTYMENFHIKNKEITLQDQDILNITFEKSTKIIPLRWNVNSRMFYPNELEHKYSIQTEKDAINNIGILHFTDRKKPWVVSCSHPLRNLYWRARVSGVYSVPLTFKEKLFKPFSGRFNYKISGSKVIFSAFGFNININKSYVLRVYKIVKSMRLK